MSQPEWISDIDIDVALAAKLVTSQFPKLSVVNIEAFGTGFDNAAFLINGQIIFRFPHRRIVAKLIKREIAILPDLAPHLSLLISAPSFIGVASPEYPWPFAGYQRIEGVTACAVSLTEAARAALAEPLARFLHALHDIDPVPFVKRGLPSDEMGRLDHEKRLKMVFERRRIFEATGLFEEFKDCFAWLEAHPPVPLDDKERRIVHGDLYARHVILDAKASPVGVIDWGDVHLGDPAIDIAIAHLTLPPKAHEAFRNAYGIIDQRTWNVALYRAIYHAILELDYGIRANDLGMRKIGGTALHLIKSALG